VGETRTCSLCFIVVNGRLYTNTIHQIHVTDIIDMTHGVTFLTGLVGFGWLRIPIERMVVHEECTLHLCLVLNGVKICYRLVTECNKYVRFGIMSISLFRTMTYSPSQYYKNNTIDTNYFTIFLQTTDVTNSY